MRIRERKLDFEVTFREDNKLELFYLNPRSVIFEEHWLNFELKYFF